MQYIQPLNLIDAVVYIGSLLLLLNRFSVKFAGVQVALKNLTEAVANFDTKIETSKTTLHGRINETDRRVSKCENDITRLDERTKPKG